MTGYWLSAAEWTAQSMVAGGTALLLGWLAARRIADPFRRQRAMGWSVRAAVLACGLALSPGWWGLAVPGWAISAEERSAEVERVEFKGADDGSMSGEVESLLENEVVVTDQAEPFLNLVAIREPDSFDPPLTENAIVERPLDRTSPLVGVAKVVLVAYWICVAIAVARQLFGHIGLARLRRKAVAVNDRVWKRAIELGGTQSNPRLLVSDRIGSPVCFGVVRPTILLPSSLVFTATDDQMHWVLAHEMDHLRRGDPRTGVWVGLARALYFPLPWFWALRRELDLTQEYLADAAAAGSRPADYAAFLVELSSRPGVSRFVRAVPSLAGVRAGRSDLYRRVTMLLESKGDRKSRGGRAWTIAAIAGAVTAAVALSGVRLTADEPKRGDKKPDGETRVDVVVRDKNAKDKKGGRKDGDPKPEGTVRDIEVIVVAESAKQTAEIEKAIEEAARKGDVEGVKKLVAKLKAVASAPRIVKGKRLDVHDKPNQPESGAKRIGVLFVADAETKKLQEALDKLKKASEDVKDQPEAKAALEKTMAEYRKRIDEARARGQLKVDEAAKGTKGQHIVPGHDGVSVLPDSIRLQIELAMRDLMKQHNVLNGDEKAAEAFKEALAKHKETLEALHKKMGPAGMQQFQFLKGIHKDFLLSVSDKGRLGVTIEAVPDIVVAQLELPKSQGVILTSVIDGTPAAKAGLKANDIVLEIAGKSITVDAMPKVVAGLVHDQPFDVVLVRKGKKETVKGLTIPAPKDSPTKNKSKDGARTSSQSSMSVSVNNDKFEIKAEQDGTKYELKGTVGETETVEIEIEKGRKNIYEGKGLKGVPSEHREKVEELLKSVGGNRK